MLRRALRFAPPTLIAALLALPLLALAVAWLPWTAGGDAARGVLGEMARTVLPGYIATTLGLALLVALGAGAVGTLAAVAVTLLDFRGRRTAEWLLLLPLAMPAYVTAYAYTDFLQFSGPLQIGLRAAFGLQGRLLPDVRSVGGAAWVFTFCLYPYVYLLVRTALAERAPQLLEAARLLGAGPRQRIVRVALPLARPALAAGIALVLMEVLADFGVASYFGIQTFSAGIFKAWLAMDDRLAAAQLATVLMGFVALLLAVEHRAQRRLRFAAGRGARSGSADARPLRLPGWRGTAVLAGCLLPVLLGFVLPVLFMLRPLVADWAVLPWQRFGGWAWNSLRLGATAAVLAVACALLLAFAARRAPSRWSTGALRVVSLGYAVPGAVVVVGLLLPVGWVQATWPDAGAGYWVTATVLGVVWAYLVRFCAVALQSVQSGYARLPPSLDDAARMLGAGGARLFAGVHLPLLRRASAAALLLVFVDVMKELPATLVLRPFGSDTLAVVTYQLARDERLGEAALPALALVAVGLLPVLWLSRTLRAPPH